MWITWPSNSRIINITFKWMNLNPQKSANRLSVIIIYFYYTLALKDEISVHWFTDKYKACRASQCPPFFVGRMSIFCGTSSVKCTGRVRTLHGWLFHFSHIKGCDDDNPVLTLDFDFYRYDNAVKFLYSFY